MGGITNRGKYNMLGILFPASVSVPANFFLQLFTSAFAPGPDSNLDGDLTEIAAGNGYTAGGVSIARNATDFDVLTEDDTNDRALVQIKDITWTASGGNLPVSGSGARYAGLAGTGLVGSRDLWTWFDLVSDRTVSDTQPLTLQDCEMRLNNV